MFFKLHSPKDPWNFERIYKFFMALAFIGLPILIYMYYFKNECECFIGFPNARNTWNHEAAGRVLLLFSSDETRSTSFWNYFSNKEISLNYHLNKFSHFKYYIWDVKSAWSSKKCVWCAWSHHLIAALWQLLNIQQLRSRYLAIVSSERTRCFIHSNFFFFIVIFLGQLCPRGKGAWGYPYVKHQPMRQGQTTTPGTTCQSKWQSADLDLLKLAKKKKSVWPALFRGNVCI